MGKEHKNLQMVTSTKVSMLVENQTDMGSIIGQTAATSKEDFEMA
jgi:hypothetical protein